MQTRTTLFRIVLAVSTLTLNALQVVHAAPLLQGSIDLVVPQIDWTPDPPSVDDIVHFTVHVENRGTLNTSPWSQVGVRLFIDGTDIGDDYASNIAPGTTEFFDFYWIATSGCHTARAVADYGDYIPESDEDNNEREESFDVTCPTPSAPSLSWPSNGSDTCDTTPYFDWSSVSGATSYRVQVDDNSSLTSPEVDTTISTSNYTPGAALAPDTYYWRVRASNSCGDGSWSSVWSVTILSTPGTPSPVSPSNGSTTDDSTPTLDWGSVTGATSYRVQVDDNSSFSSPEIDQTASSSSYTPSGALADGAYHWRVQASNSCGSGSWSAVWSLTIETFCPTPSAPSLYSPANGSSTCDTTPYFDWSSVSGATSYRIQVDDSSSFTSPAIDTTASNTNYTPGTALSPGAHYWRVRASNSCGYGSWSSVWSVTILSTPGVPSLISPPNGITTDDDTPTFDWDNVSGATSYHIQVDDNSSFSSPEIDQTTSSSSYTPSSALADGPYHWRVQASNCCGSASWSSAWSFTIETPCPTPSAPSLYSPSDSSSTCDTTPYFDWSSVSGATSYRIQVDDRSSFSSPVIDTTTSGSNYTPGTALTPGTMYYWRVNATNLDCGGTGPWSTVWSFSLTTPDNMVYFEPQDSSTSFCNTTSVDIKVDATDFKSGQIKFTYNSACADVAGWARNTSHFPGGTWESAPPGQEWITFSAQDAITGAYSIGTLTVRSISEEPCTTALDFVEDGPMTSKLFDDWGSEVSAAWQDGTFQGRGSILYLPIVFRNHTPGTELPNNPLHMPPILHPQTGPPTRAQITPMIRRFPLCPVQRL